MLSALDTAEAIAATLCPRSDAAAQVRSLGCTHHRPWPLPTSAWLQGQTWRDLLFAHWPVPAEILREVVPPILPVDTFDGTAWIGITPFEVTGLRLRGTPPAPGLSRFAETNVRTYTTVGGAPGIHFLSLDAASTLAVAAARLTYRLPYRRARMSIERAEGEIHYRTQRLGSDARLEVRYGPTRRLPDAAPGTLEHFLTERYRLYTVDQRGAVYSADIHHAPWPLHAATAEFTVNTMTQPSGIKLPLREPVLHYSPRQDVLIWPLRRMGA